MESTLDERQQYEYGLEALEIYEAELAKITEPEYVEMPCYGTYKTHLCPELKVAFEFARYMKNIKTQHEDLNEMADFVFNDYSWIGDIGHRMWSIDAEYGRESDLPVTMGSRFSYSTYYHHVASKWQHDNGKPRLEPRDEDMCERVTKGEVGKILWEMVKKSVTVKSTVDFWRGETAVRRYAPGGFVEIATSASESGDERLEFCAKRALKHDVLERIVRARLGAEAYSEIEAAVEERVGELLA
jgi:hypothetical protein